MEACFSVRDRAFISVALGRFSHVCRSKGRKNLGCTISRIMQTSFDGVNSGLFVAQMKINMVKNGYVWHILVISKAQNMEMRKEG